VARYRIPLSDREALARLSGSKDVVSWTIVVPDNVAIVEVGRDFLLPYGSFPGVYAWDWPPTLSDNFLLPYGSFSRDSEKD